MTFRATIILGGKTATGFEVPAEVVAGLGSSKRPAVHVELNGYRYRSTVAVMGGRFLVPVSAEIRANAGVAAGDEADVNLELDSDPREVDVPADLAAALAAEPAAQVSFDGLSYSHRRQYVLAIEGAKTAATRERRVAKAVEALREGRR